MNNIEECMITYRAGFKIIRVKFYDTLLTKVTTGYGPSIYNRDDSNVTD